MKKKVRKAIELLSKQLPVSYEQRVHTKRVFVKDLPAETKIKHKLLNEDGNVMMDQKGEYIFKVNHIQRLKKAYTRARQEGIQEYIIRVDRNNKRMAEKYKDINRVDKKLMRIAQGPIKTFWYNLLIFLYAFAKVFNTNDKTGSNSN